LLWQLIQLIDCVAQLFEPENRTPNEVHDIARDEAEIDAVRASNQNFNVTHGSLNVVLYERSYPRVRFGGDDKKALVFLVHRNL
jgi:hypothetical protein